MEHIKNKVLYPSIAIVIIGYYFGSLRRLLTDTIVPFFIGHGGFSAFIFATILVWGVSFIFWGFDRGNMQTVDLKSQKSKVKK